MNFSFIPRVAAKVGRALKNAAPEIAVVAGTVGLVTAGIVACKQTPKAMQVIERHKESTKILETAAEKGVTEAGEAYTPADFKKDKQIIFGQDAGEIIRIYSIPVLIAILSVTSIFAGGHVFRKRITALTGAYALLESNFSKYRKSVIEKFGKDIDQEIRLGTSKELVEETVIDEDGNEKTEMKEVTKSTYDGYSMYARIFDETNPEWEKDARFNFALLQAREKWWNDKLKTNGFVFLNDVYEDLGFERTPEGQLVGWIYDPDDKSIDSVIDFGLLPIIKDKNQYNNVLRDRERSFVLDFNCDGRILEKFKKYDTAGRRLARVR